MQATLTMVGGGLFLACLVISAGVMLLAEVIQSLLRLLGVLLPVAVVVLLIAIVIGTRR